VKRSRFEGNATFLPGRRVVSTWRPVLTLVLSLISFATVVSCGDPDKASGGALIGAACGVT
jgi:hypothetical protein